MKKRLTLRRALRICRDLWQWLEKNPDKEKRDWGGWVEYGYMENYCPCCQYVVNHRGGLLGTLDECERCPLSDLWEDENKCENDESPYSIWCHAEGDHEERSKQARIIWQAADKELKRLRGKRV